MKRLIVLILVLTLLIVTGTLVSADAQTMLRDSDSTKTISNITEASDGIR